MQGNAQATDYSFMYDIRDLRSNKTVPKYTDNSITSFIFNNPEFSIFKIMLLKSQNDVRYSQPQANFTVFITPDSEILKQFDENVFLNMDLYTSRQIILYNTIPKVISQKSMKEIRDIFEYRSRIEDSLLRITNFGSGLFINDCKVIGVKECNNGIIYVLDKFNINEPMYQ